MSPVTLPAEVIDQAADRISAILDDVAEQVGGRPTLGEFLEVLGWALPSRAVDGVYAPPVTVKATVKPRKAYASGEPSRTGELTDAVFADTNDVLGFLADSVDAAGGRPVSAGDLASSVASALRAGNPAFADVRGEQVVALAVAAGRRSRKPAVGDVIAIPARRGGYHLAVVVARNRFGTALGLLRGTPAVPRVGPRNRSAARRPVHTSDHSVAAGDWTVVGHDETLLALFPGDPEIYHDPKLTFSGVDLGEFGAAETAGGTLRLIDEDEAREVGLLDGTYRQTYVSEYLQQALDDAVEGDRET